MFILSSTTLTLLVPTGIIHARKQTIATEIQLQSKEHKTAEEQQRWTVLRTESTKCCYLIFIVAIQLVLAHGFAACKFTAMVVHAPQASESITTTTSVGIADTVASFPAHQCNNEQTGNSVIGQQHLYL